MDAVCPGGKVGDLRGALREGDDVSPAERLQARIRPLVPGFPVSKMGTPRPLGVGGLVFTPSSDLGKDKAMKQYWIALYRTQGFDPSVELDASDRRRIDALNGEMLEAGVRIFVGGLRPGETARSFVPQPNGKVISKVGPHSESGHYVDGFWVLSCRDVQEAEEWGSKAARACRGSVEVRPFY